VHSNVQKGKGKAGEMKYTPQTKLARCRGGMEETLFSRSEGRERKGQHWRVT